MPGRGRRGAFGAGMSLNSQGDRRFPQEKGSAASQQGGHAGGSAIQRHCDGQYPRTEGRETRVSGWGGWQRDPGFAGGAWRWQGAAPAAPRIPPAPPASAPRLRPPPSTLTRLRDSRPTPSAPDAGVCRGVRANYPGPRDDEGQVRVRPRRGADTHTAITRAHTPALCSAAREGAQATQASLEVVDRRGQTDPQHHQRIEIVAIGSPTHTQVDEAGTLVGNLSVADLRGITPPHLDVLALPVGDFLRETHGVQPKGATKARRWDWLRTVPASLLQQQLVDIRSSRLMVFMFPFHSRRSPSISSSTTTPPSNAGTSGAGLLLAGSGGTPAGASRAVAAS